MLHHVQKPSGTKNLKTLLAIQFKIIRFCCHESGHSIFNDKDTLIKKFGENWGKWLFERVWKNDQKTEKNEFGKLIFQLIDEFDWVNNQAESQAAKIKILEAFLHDVRYEKYINRAGVSFKFKYPNLHIDIKENTLKILKNLNEKFYDTIFKTGSPIQNSLTNYSRKDFVREFWNENKLDVCPACDDKKPPKKNEDTLSENDHFLPKSIFPFLAIHSSNLLPVCKYCNQSFKGAEVAIDVNADNVLSTSFFPYEFPAFENIDVKTSRNDKNEFEVKLCSTAIENEIRVTNLNKILDIDKRWTDEIANVFNSFINDASSHFHWTYQNHHRVNPTDIIDSQYIENFIKFKIKEKNNSIGKIDFNFVTLSFLTFVLSNEPEQDEIRKQLIQTLKSSFT